MQKAKVDGHSNSPSADGCHDVFSRKSAAVNKATEESVQLGKTTMLQISTKGSDEAAQQHSDAENGGKGARKEQTGQNAERSNKQETSKGEREKHLNGKSGRVGEKTYRVVNHNKDIIA